MRVYKLIPLTLSLSLRERGNNNRMISLVRGHNMNKKVFAWVSIIIVSAGFGIGRFYIPGHAATGPGTYEAFAHMWIGAMFVFAMKEAIWVFKKLFKKDPGPFPVTGGLAAVSGLTITGIELYMFIHQGWFEATVQSFS